MATLVAAAATTTSNRGGGKRVQYLDSLASEQKAIELLAVNSRCFRFTRFSLAQFYELLNKLGGSVIEGRVISRAQRLLIFLYIVAHSAAFVAV